MKKAKALYLAVESSEFNLMHCFEILSKHVKWAPISNKKRKSASKKGKERACSSTSLEAGQDKGTEDEEEEEEEEECRPVGRKAAKKQMAMKHSDNRHKEKLVLIQEKIARELEEKNKIFERMRATSDRVADFNVMNTDASTILDPARRNWMLMMQQHILSKNIFGTTPSTDGDAPSPDNNEEQ